MSDATQPPAATGSLARTPFAHLVLYLYQRRASGTLIVQPIGHMPMKVLFHRGRAVAAHIPQPSLALDQGLMPLAAAGAGEFEFHEEDLVGSGPGIVTGMFDPFAFVAEAARRHAREEIVAEILRKHQDIALALDPAMDLTRLSLTADEARFTSILLRGPATLEALYAQQFLPLQAARRLMYALLITKTVIPNQPVPEREAQRQSDSAPRQPVRRSSEPIARPSRPMSERLRPSGDAWRAIANRAAEMAENRHSAVPRRPGSQPETRDLRVRASSQSLNAARPSQPGAQPPSSTQPPSSARTPQAAEALRSATPDPQPSAANRAPASSQTSQRAPELRGGDSRPLRRPLTPGPGSMRGSAPISRPISRPLTPTPYRDSNPSDRVTPASAMKRVSPRPSLPEVETLDADGKLKRVELLCQRNSYEDALPIIRGLLEEDRKNAKYLGVLSHVLLGKAGADATIGKEIIDAVNQALRIDPDQVHALYTKARCYKRLGKEREALHYFKRTVAVDPNHLEATREMRLLVLRMSEKKGKR